MYWVIFIQNLQYAVTLSTLTAGTASCTAYSSTTAALTCGGASGGTTFYSYQWYRSTVNGFTPSSANILIGQTSLSLSDSGLSASTNYYYVCGVKDTAGNSALSNQVNILTLSAVVPSGGPFIVYLPIINGSSVGMIGSSGGNNFYGWQITSEVL